MVGDHLPVENEEASDWETPNSGLHKSLTHSFQEKKYWPDYIARKQIYQTIGTGSKNLGAIIATTLILEEHKDKIKNAIHRRLNIDDL